MSYSFLDRCPNPRPEPPSKWTDIFVSAEEKDRIASNRKRIASNKRKAEWSKTLNAFNKNKQQKEIKLTYSDCNHTAIITKNQNGFSLKYGHIGVIISLTTFNTISEVIDFIHHKSEGISYGRREHRGNPIMLPPCDTLQRFVGSDKCRNN
jgi:hypothetical protein